jgi:predicted DNA-binding transcriptional regulator AlpA
MAPDIGLSEVVDLLGCSKSAALKYMKRPDFPPARKLARGRVWDREEVKAWGKRSLPLQTGRPPKQT